MTQTADSLRSGGYTGRLTLVADEACQPYQRPPLSKDYMKAEGGIPLPLRGETFLRDNDITLIAGSRAVSVDRAARTVHLGDGSTVDYDHLVIATGARNRRLTSPGADLSGVHGLRTLANAEALGAALGSARDVVVVGAGFIGLEFATAALARGCRVTVLEFAPRPMGRAVTPLLSEWFARAHRGLGIDLRLEEGIASFEAGDDDCVVAAVSTTGERFPADLVVVGIGVQPNDDLAADAGLETGNGIVVDAYLRTSDPCVLAVGDCANFPSVHLGGPSRLESVQNATDQGRHAARAILGADEPYDDLPWFWSLQGPYRLQMAGVALPSDSTMVVGDMSTAKFSVLCFRGGRLTAAESVNAPGDHMAARKLLGSGIEITWAESEGFSLRGAVKKHAVLAA